MEKILENGKANGVVCERIDVARLRELEPHAAGIAAIHIPESGIVDYAQVARRLAELVTAQGSNVVTSARATAIRRDTNGAIVETPAGEFAAQQVVNCAGLFSDRVTRLSGARPSSQIVPFRGEFYLVRPEAHHLVRMLIYPVPDPRYPFLGVHFTRRIDGRVECGPNAVLAFAREGYRNTTVNLRDLAETLRYIGFWRLAGRYWRIGAAEMWRSFNKGAFVRAAQRLVPEIEPWHFEWAPAGVRAQAVSPDGAMVDDFVINETDRVVNVENAPSPAATASLNIGRLVVERLVPRFQ
jgi:L-2-hydroxyglutarate oxidase